jgi:serine/threonine protein phosphatase PrpC
MMHPEPALRLEIGQFSHPGRQRANNEDWLGTFQPDDPARLASKGCLFLVADGMGGHQSGELASRQVVDRVIRDYVDDPELEVAASLRQAIEAANASLYARSAKLEGRPRSGSTLVAAVVRGVELWIANVGDSRAYLLHGGELRQLTRDHALFPLTGNHIPAEEAPGRHIITRALGTKPSVEVDVFPPLRLRRGDRLILCSDGLTAPLSGAEILRVVANLGPQESAEALVQAANDRGGPDNVSVIVIQVVGHMLGWASVPRFRVETWGAMLQRLLHLLPGGDQGLRSPLFLVTILLGVLVLIGLGFILGLILF